MKNKLELLLRKDNHQAFSEVLKHLELNKEELTKILSEIQTLI